MPTSRRPFRRPALFAAAAGALLLLALAPPASALPGKEVELVLHPGTLAAGTSGSIDATFRNPATARQQLGSANLTPPAGFTVTSATIGRGTATVRNGVVELRNLALAPGATAAATLAVRAPCSAPADARWGVTLKQANNFSGSGNDMTLTAGSVRTTEVTGRCTLRWIEQPEDAEAGEVISGTPYATGGPAVAVAVFDGAGTRIPTATGGVNLRFGLQGGFGSLSGATSSLAGAGGARFEDLSISLQGTYTLVAQVTSGPYLGLATVPSGRFRVDTFVQRCLPGLTCSQPVDTGRADLSVSALAADDSPYLAVSPDAGPELTPARCGGWTGYSADTTLFNVTRDPGADGMRAKRVSLTVDKAAMNFDPDNGAPRLELCFGSPEPFDGKGGAGQAPVPGLTFDWDTDGDDDAVYAGLLADCSDTSGPCVTQRKKVGAGRGYIEARLPSTLGDPAMRG